MGTAGGKEKEQVNPLIRKRAGERADVNHRTSRSSRLKERLNSADRKMAKEAKK